VQDGQPTIVKLANSWVIINVGGGPTDEQTRGRTGTTDRSHSRQRLPQPPGGRYPGHLRGVALPGAEFLTPPKVHSREIRCYMRDPDGHLIEVGQTTGVPS
jgi:catechol 2,3-dioxygenase-like lactoylglutathione lyase family enzyme